jgi:capsular polysaccharide biosynthesis protein
LEETVEFREYWNILWKRGWIILVVALVAAIVAFGVSQIMPKTYRATIQLNVEPARPDYGLNQATKDLLRNYVVNVRSHNMTQEAINRAQLDMTTDQFLADLDVSVDASNLTITFVAESRDPEEARLMAQTLAEVFVQDRDAWNEKIDVRDRIYVSVVDNIRYVPLASPNWKINTLAGAVFGAIAGGVIVFFLEWLQSDIVRTPADVQKSLGVPVIGTIPATGQAATSKTTTRRLLPSWIEPVFLLVFATGLLIGAALGGLVVALL